MASVGDALYARVLRPILFRLDAETAHRLTLALLSALPVASRAPDPPKLRVDLWGMEFPNPVGLAAGMDKDVVAGGAWQTIGFGFVEFGTMTPRPQPGNPRPRMWRLAEHSAIVNRLGFPGAGMEAAARRLARLRERGLKIPVGVNIGPNRDTPPERIVEDYAALARMLTPLADFVVINVSSPNTPGLRDWQEPEKLREIVAAVRSAQAAAARRVPLLVKVSPDLDVAQLARICEESVALNLDGIVATNTTLARAEAGVTSAPEGGLSGRPLRERARSVVRDIYRQTAGKLPIIGVGGVASAEDAYGHIRAGASLIELYTGMVYGGPGLVAEIKRGLLRLLARDRLSSIADAIGREI